MRLSRLLTALLCSALLAGCASSATPPSTYMLPVQDTPETGAQHSAGAGEEAPPLVLRTLRLAPFLDVKGIVFQLDDVRLREAGSHQWAEPLAAQLERGLRDRLASRLPQHRVLLDPALDGETPALSLRVDIDRFQGHRSGHAVVAGRWQLRDARGEPLAHRRFAFKTPLEADGYPALVRALAEGLDRLADEISEQARNRN
ncbi:MAG TPA: ABC-type transport auxiliary lipoprotein family protein [Halomonas sp.]|nr:ABC-type transport auxiliary lipoprotein family protein [Halomonas sp.]